MIYSIIFIFYPDIPRIQYDSSKKSQTLKAGQTIILHADITGCPTPKVAWTFEGEPVQLSAKTTIETTDTYSTLTVKDCNKDFTGNYSVTAENKVGSDSATFNVNVRGK